MMSILMLLKRKTVNKMSVETNNESNVRANDVQDALENSWGWFLNHLEENEVEDESAVKQIVERVLDLVELELAE
jgi:hypothetical protein